LIVLAESRQFSFGEAKHFAYRFVPHGVELLSSGDSSMLVLRNLLLGREDAAL